MTRVAAALVALSFLFSSPVGAAPAEDSLYGTIQYSMSRHLGSTDLVENSTMAAYFGWDDGQPLAKPEANWSLHADRIVVNWTLYQAMGVGSAPGDPNSTLISLPPRFTYGESAYSNATAQGLLDSLFANLLLTSNAEASLEANAIVETVLRPTEQETWYAGSATGVDTPPGQSGPTWRVHSLAPGSVLGNASSPIDVVVQGDFILNAWGGARATDVLVADADGVHRYRSGEWWDNATGTATGPRGAARTEYEQFLELRLSNATLTIDQEQGAAKWIGTGVSVVTNGNVWFEEAQGNLESSRYFYTPKGDAFNIQGIIRVNASSNLQSSVSLKANVNAQAIAITQPAAGGVAPTPASPREEPPNLAPSTESPEAAIDGSSASAGNAPWWLTGLLAAGALGYAVVRLRSRNGNPERTIVRAEAALSQDRPQEAVRLLRHFLRAHPRHVDGWFLHANALYRVGDFQGIVRDITALDASIKEVPSIALVLSHAYGQLGQQDEVEQWRLVAERDPELARVMSKTSPPTLSRRPPLPKRRRRGQSEAAGLDSNVAYS